MVVSYIHREIGETSMGLQFLIEKNLMEKCIGFFTRNAVCLFFSLST